MTFRSILNPSPDGEDPAERSAPPACFGDLNLDQIVASIIAGRQDYNLAPIFYQPLRSREAVEYRQGVMRDLDDRVHYDAVAEFAKGARTVRDYVAQAQKLRHKYQKEAWVLDAVDVYCQAVGGLHAHFRYSVPSSAGLTGFAGYLDGYVVSPEFRGLTDGAAALREKLDGVRYTVRIRDSVITVTAFQDEPDYGAEIQADFDKFKQGAAADHVFKFSDFEQMNHIEAGVLDRVALLCPEVFAELDAFISRNGSFFDATIARFDREAQFYLAYIAHMRRISGSGLAFCYPTVSNEAKAVSASQCYDLALAGTLLDQGRPVVPNDFFLAGRERIIIVSGPNQGGKTTFARMFGQLYHLAAIGCPVPAASARLYLFDEVFTHFEKEEDVLNFRGKLHDDLFRLRSTLDSATSDSVIILNEVFNSTSLKDAIFLSAEILTRIIALDAVCVCVTFIDELAALSDTTVSMASSVNPANVAERTFKIVRRPPDGLAYALSIAQKYRLTYTQLRDRLSS